MAYPTSSDLSDYLSANGVTLTTAQEAQLENEISSAIDLFERLVGRKMEAGEEDEDRFFDPPDNQDGRIFFKEDLAAVTSINYQPVCSGSTSLLVSNVDYGLWPRNANLRNKPFRGMNMGSMGHSTPVNIAYRGSYKVTGRWGYALEMPASAFMAMLKLATVKMVTPLSFASTGGVKSKKIEDYSVEYGTGQYSSQIGSWVDEISTVVKLFRIPF